MMHRPWLLGTAVAAVTIIIGVGLVLWAASGDDRSGATDMTASAGGSSSVKSTTTTSTTSTTTTTTPPPQATTPTVPEDVVVGEDEEALDPPDPADAYQPIPLPGGVSATIDTCGWSPANGGQLEASGNLSNIAGEDDIWLLTVYWLQRNGNQDEEIDEQTELYDLEIGLSTPWQLTIGAPVAPPNVSCAIEVE
jgi:hypothetical protein